MHCRRAIFFFAGLSAALLLGGGCRRATPDYESLRGDLLQDVIEGLATEDSAAVLKALDRLAPLTDEDAFVVGLGEQEKARALLRRLDQALRQGEFERAAALLRDHRDLQTRIPEVQRAATGIAALAVLRSYLAGLPYANASQQAEALQQLEHVAPALADSPLFGQRLAAEQTALAKRRAAEYHARLNLLLEACDQAVASQAIDTQIRFANLREFAPDSLPARCFMALRDNRLDDAIALLAASDLGNDPQAMASVEITFLNAYDKLRPGDRVKLEKALGKRTPNSRSGRLLRLRLAADGGRDLELLLHSRQLLREDGKLTEPLIALTLARGVMPRELFNAKPWRTPFPTLADLAGCLVLWQENRPPANPAPQP